jgi:hypothetical protein
MSNSKTRDEAGVIGPGDLTPDQRRALEQIAEHAARLATADEEKPADKGRWRFLPHVDKKRENHVFLIDGDRGTSHGLAFALYPESQRRPCVPRARRAGAPSIDSCPARAQALFVVGRATSVGSAAGSIT